MPSPATKKKTKANADQEEKRAIVYDEIKVRIAAKDPPFEDPLTVAQAKEMLGWEELPKESEDHTLLDALGTKVRLNRNHRNRPFDRKRAMQYAQEILNLRFAPKGPNLETIVVGKYGSVTSGQHRGVGLVLAGQIWAGAHRGKKEDQSAHWKENWSSEPTIDTLVAYGADESMETLRTYDNVKPRTVADVLFSDERMFGTYKPKERVKLCRMADYAVRFLWSRTGRGLDAYTPTQTNSESADWMDLHPTVKQAVLHIAEENKGTPPPLSVYLSPGALAGLMYLMATSGADSRGYALATPKREMRSERASFLKFEERAPGHGDYTWWDMASEFFVSLNSQAKSDQSMGPVRYCTRSGKNGATDYIFAHGEGAGSASERVAVLILAWKAFVAKEEITQDTLQLSYKEDGTLDTWPQLDGIDVGDPNKPEDEPEPTEEEIAEGKAQIKEENGHGNGEDKAEKKRKQREKIISDRAAKSKAKEEAASSLDEDIDRVQEEDEESSE